MRWDKLFDDLESQLERELTAEDLDLGAEEERLRLGRLSLRSRVEGLLGETIVIWFADGSRLAVRPESIGRDWFSAEVLGESAARRPVIVPIAALAGVTVPASALAGSLAARDDDPGGPALTARLGFAFVLRDLCRRRRAVRVELAAGSLHGTIDRVGRDHLDLAVHEPGTARRNDAVRELRIVAFDAVRWVAV